MVLYWIFKGASQEDRRTVLRMPRMPVQRPIEGAMISNDSPLECGAVPTKGRQIAVDFVDADPVHCPIRQAPCGVHQSAGGGKLSVAKSKRLCKASFRSAKLFHSTRWH